MPIPSIAMHEGSIRGLEDECTRSRPRPSPWPHFLGVPDHFRFLNSLYLGFQLVGLVQFYMFQFPNQSFGGCGCFWTIFSVYFSCSGGVANYGGPPQFRLPHVRGYHLRLFPLRIFLHYYFLHLIRHFRDPLHSHLHRHLHLESLPNHSFNGYSRNNLSFSAPSQEILILFFRIVAWHPPTAPCLFWH